MTSMLMPFILLLSFAINILFTIFLVKSIVLIVKKNYTRGRIILFLIIGFIILSICLISIDINQIENNREPKCTLPIYSLKDGGSTKYIGLGYGIMDYHSISGKEENGVMIHGYYKGYTIDILNIPIIEKELVFVPDK